MSIQRAALRLAAVMALSNGMTTPYPSIAGNRVFDSRMDPISGLNPGDLAPIAIVYTDDDRGESLSNNNGGPPFRSNVNLIFELSIGLVSTLTDENNQPLLDEDGRPMVAPLPISTEPELELMLDIFEAQVLRIFGQPTTPWQTRLWDKHLVRIESWESQRFVERDAKNRLAARLVTAKCLLPQADADEIVNSAGSPTVPEPLGSLLTAIVAANGPYKASAQSMIDLVSANGGFGPLVLPDLTKVRIIEANAGGGLRPDGVAQANLEGV